MKLNPLHSTLHFSLLAVSFVGGCSPTGDAASGGEEDSPGSSQVDGQKPEGVGGGNPPGDDGAGIEIGQGSGGVAGDDSCATDRADSAPLPVDLMVLLDQSGSMTIDSPNRWDPVTSALKGFVADPSLRNLRLGLQYFPLGATTTEDPAICMSSNYEVPDVPLVEFPGAREQATSSIDAHYFTVNEGADPAHWGTPTRPALEGTYQYLRSFAEANPESTPILILATDGKPSKLCFNEADELDGIAEITAVIADAAAGQPPIPTYVIGIGEIERLDEWAMAGGTGRSAFIVDASNPQQTQTEFALAMDEIRGAVVPCDYPIPDAASGIIDFGRVNVEMTRLDGSSEALVQVASEAACTGGLDWFYDDPAEPSVVSLCPSSCETINQEDGSVELVFGCRTVVR